MHHQLQIEASVAAIPIVTGHPLAFAEGPSSHLVFLPDLPDQAQLWAAHHIMMILWLLSSLVSLILMARIFLADGIFLGAEFAAVLGIAASSMHLCNHRAAGDQGSASAEALAVTAEQLCWQHAVSATSIIICAGRPCPKQRLAAVACRAAALQDCDVHLSAAGCVSCCFRLLLEQCAIYYVCQSHGILVKFVQS
jgi:hypothetical protein